MLWLKGILNSKTPATGRATFHYTRFSKPYLVSHVCINAMLLFSGDDAVWGVQGSLLGVVIFEWKITAADLTNSTEEKNEEKHGCHLCRSFSHAEREWGQYPEVSCPSLLDSLIGVKSSPGDFQSVKLYIAVSITEQWHHWITTKEYIGIIKTGYTKVLHIYLSSWIFLPGEKGEERKKASFSFCSCDLTIFTSLSGHICWRGFSNIANWVMLLIMQQYKIKLSYVSIIGEIFAVLCVLSCCL